MLILNPDRVRFGDIAWHDVLSIAAEAAPERAVVEWSDLGPHAAFADVPEVRTTLKVSRSPQADDLASVKPGQRGVLEFFTSPGADARRVRIEADCIIERTSCQFITGKGAVQTITLIALSPDGAADPLTIEPV